MIRVVLPQHLRTLAHVGMEVQVSIQGPVTQRSILDAIEAQYPMLEGTIRDHVTKQRRPSCVFSRVVKIFRTNRRMRQSRKRS